MKIADSIVVGYHGQGAKEYMCAGFSSVKPVELGDTLEFARLVESSILGFNRLGDRYLMRSREKVARLIATRYSMEEERKAVLGFWREMFEHRG